MNEHHSAEDKETQTILARQTAVAAGRYITRHLSTKPNESSEQVTKHDLTMAVLLLTQSVNTLIEIVIDPESEQREKVDAAKAYEQGFAEGVKAGDNIYAQTPAQARAVNDFIIENG